MAKRGLSLLLAVLSVLSLAVPAFAEEEAVEEPEEVLEEVVEPETVAATSGYCGAYGNNVQWSFAGDTLTFSGNGAMQDFDTYFSSATHQDESYTPWSNLKERIKNVVIQSGVTSIGGNAFRNCTALTDVTIPDGVIHIGYGAFYYCASLTSVTIPDSVTSIEAYAFWQCMSLTSVTIPSGVTSIGQWAFGHTPWEAAQGDFEIVNGILLMYQGSAANVTIPNGVTSVGDMAFRDCKSLSSITIPGSVISIGYMAFRECDGLTSVTLSAGVTSIGTAAFLFCSSLTSVTIPASVTSIGDAAFQLCDSLTSITILNPNCTIVDQWGDGVSLGVPGQTVVHGYDCSTAETYAKQWGYKFEALVPAPTPVPATPTPVPATPTPMPTATPAAKLAAPTVTISKVSTGIKVSWNKVSGSPRYMVYYKEGNGGWKKIGTTTSTTYTRAAKYLKNNVTYTFTVRCCENDKKTLLGPYKASNSLKFVGQLAAPTVKIAKVSTGIKVSWNKIAGSPRYMVYYKEGNGGWKKIGTTTATSYTRAAKYLKSGTTYQFTVRCCQNDKKTMLGPYKASNSLKYTK